MQFNVTRAKVERIDKKNVYEVYSSWPRFADEGARIRVDLPGRDYPHATYIGVGGSASAGEIISDWLRLRGRPTMRVERSVPRGASMRGDLVIACSVSGETKETLEAAKLSAEQGSTVVVICSGGRLEEFAREMALPLVKIPRGSAPRYSLPHLLFTSLRVLGRAFTIDGLEEEIDDSLRALERIERKLRLSTPLERNPAKRLAAAIWRSIPKIYGSTITRGVALRFKNALNENAKMHALADSSPELFHNEIEAWEKKDQRGFVPIYLRHSSEPPGESRRFDYMIRTLRSSGIDSLVEKGEGRTPLGELCTLTYLLDFASYYTAIANGVDPHPTPLIDALKRDT